MELTRYHYMTIGVVALLLGLQFRYVETYQLNEQATQFLAQRFQAAPPPAALPLLSIINAPPPLAPRKTIVPPKWIGWSLISIGAVLSLQSLAMRKA